MISRHQFLRKRDLRVPFFLFAAVLSLGCSGGGGGDDDDGPEAFKLVLDAPPFQVTEETEVAFHLLVLSTADEATSWSGDVTISAVGPVSPALVTVSNGEAMIPVSLELGGDNNLTFAAAGLQSATAFVYVAPRVPAKVDGSLTGSSVFAGGGAWDPDGAWSPSVLIEGGTYYLYYASANSGGPENIGVATSTDGGVTFFGRPAPLVGPAISGSTCHTNGADAPNVHRAGATFVMTYAGAGASGAALCRATSSDLLVWTPETTPVLVVTTSGEGFDNIALRGAAVVELEDGSRRALYASEGSGDVAPGDPGPETIGALGLAEVDGSTWTRLAGNRAFGSIEIGALEFQETGEWDSFGIGGPAIQREGPVFRVWATGLGSGMVYRIGRYAALDLQTLGAHIENPFGDATEVIGVSAGRFDENGALAPSVVEDSAGLRSVYYTGIGADDVRRIGLARF